jgi:hypothetical protein
VATWFLAVEFGTLRYVPVLTMMGLR